jgi:hypothetical protein
LTYIANGGFSWWYRGPNGSSLRGLLRRPTPRGIHVCKADGDAIFGLSTWRGVGGGQEEAFNPSRGVSGRARVVLGVKVFGL